MFVMPVLLLDVFHGVHWHCQLRNREDIQPLSACWQTDRRPFNSQDNLYKPAPERLKQHGFSRKKSWWGCSGMSWMICKSFAPRSRQISSHLQTDNHASTSALNFFADQMLCLTPIQQCQSTEYLLPVLFYGTWPGLEMLQKISPIKPNWVCQYVTVVVVVFFVVCSKDLFVGKILRFSRLRRVVSLCLAVLKYCTRMQLSSVGLSGFCCRWSSIFN